MMILAIKEPPNKRCGYGAIVCTSGDIDLQRQCAGYDNGPEWCRWCYDPWGQVSDLCYRPGILGMEGPPPAEFTNIDGGLEGLLCSTFRPSTSSCSRP